MESYKRGKIVAIRLNGNDKPKIHRISYTDSFLKAFLGGRGFNSALLYFISKEMMKQGSKDKLPDHWRSGSNVIAISGGLLAGTPFPSSGRTTVS